MYLQSNTIWRVQVWISKWRSTFLIPLIKSFHALTTFKIAPSPPRPLSVAWVSFFNCYLAAPRPTLGHCRGGSLTNQMLITVFDSWFEPKVTVGFITRVGPKGRPSVYIDFFILIKVNSHIKTWNHFSTQHNTMVRGKRMMKNSTKCL